MTRKGRELEKLVEALENYLCLSNKSFTIECPAFVEDRITGDLREIDVLLTSGQGHHMQKTAFECKDWNRKVGVPEVEAFITKTKDLKINKSIIVSSNGFYSTAIEKAKFYNISCLNMEEVKTFKWIETDKIQKIQKHLINQHWHITTDDESVQNVVNFVVMHSSGIKFTTELMNTKAFEYFNAINVQELEVGKKYKYLVNHNIDDFIIVDQDLGKQYKVTGFELHLEFEIKTEEIPIKFIEYCDVTEDSKLASGVAAEIKINDEIAGYMMIIEQEDGTNKLVYTQQSKPNK